jgi:hypothetical protein
VINDIPELPTGSLVIPFKGEWSSKAIKSVDFTVPTDAVDILEMLGGLLGAGDQGLYDEYGDYEDYDYNEALYDDADLSVLE